MVQGQLFSTGDIVKLKSGGPDMTVERYLIVKSLGYSRESNHEVICSWFDAQGKHHARTFEQDALEKV